MADIDPFSFSEPFSFDAELERELDLGGPLGEEDDEEEEEEEDGANTETISQVVGQALQEMQNEMQRDWVTAERSTNAPLLTTLYDIDRDELNVKESTERGVRAIWQLLFDFQKAQEITPGYHRQFGLCLYAKASFTKEDGGDESKFEVQTVKSFFQFMRQKRTTVPNLRKAVTFLNAHLKGEFYARLRHIGHTPLKISGAMVGHLLTVKNAIAASNAEKADLAWENRDELLDAIDEMFGKSLITKLISCAYQEQPPDKLKSMNPLLKVQFAAAFTYAMQTGRRGEESFKQKVVQRFVRKIEELGIGGTPCGFVLTNKSKRNKVGRRECVALWC